MAQYRSDRRLELARHSLSLFETPFCRLLNALLVVACGVRGMVRAGVEREEEGTSHSRGENQWHLVLQVIQNQLCTPSWGKPTVR